MGSGSVCSNLYPVLMDSADSIIPAFASIDWQRTVGSLADWVTLGAFTITLIGLLSAFLTRGRLRSSVSTRPSPRSFTWTLTNAGASPVQQIAYHQTWITRTGRPVAGDGTIPLVQALYPGENFRIEVFDSEQVRWPGDERSDELRMPSPSSADGAVVVLTWRSPLIPWRRKRLVIILMFGQPEINLRGRRARRVDRDVISSGSDSLPAAIKLELARANGGVLPTEQSVQDRYPREIEEVHPRMLAQVSGPGRVQLYLEDKLLADGRLEEYMFSSPAVPLEEDARVSLDAAERVGGFIRIDGQKFELNDSHRLRIFGR